MELEINGKTYSFVFGYGFLKEINRKFAIVHEGQEFRIGAMERVSTGLYGGDIQTIAEVLKCANQTEKPKISEDELAEFIADDEDDKVTDKLIEELKKSKFTKKKILEFEKRVKKAK